MGRAPGCSRGLWMEQLPDTSHLPVTRFGVIIKEETKDKEMAIMNTVTLRFYAELGDLLDPGFRGRTFEHHFWGQAQAKDLIESLGVPHTEVELLLVDGQPAPFTRVLTGGEHLSVYPHFRTLDVSGTTRITENILARPPVRFAADAHLGKLARYLRMAGFDTLWDRSLAEEELALRADEEDRMLLTRDRGLLKRVLVARGSYVHTQDPEDQLAEVIDRFRLENCLQPFSRCMHCNVPVIPVPKEEVSDRLPPEVRKHCQAFTRCPACNRIYWQGTHHEHMERLLCRIRKEPPVPTGLG